MRDDDELSTELCPLLEETSDLPPELRGALRALRDERPSRALLQRVGTRLEPLFGSAAPRVELDGGPRGLDSLFARGSSRLGWLREGSTGKWLVGLLGVAALIGSSYVLRASLPTPTAAHPGEAAAPFAAPAPPRPSAAAEPGQEASGVPERAAEPRAQLAASDNGARAERRDPSSRSRAPRTRAPAKKAVEQRSASSLGPESASGHSGLAADVEPAPSASGEPTQPEPTQATAPEPSREQDKPQPPSETALLLRARALAKSDPTRALSLLEEHAARFSGGLLSPEREVLAIEVLRDLRREAEADARLRNFRLRYPDSAHLRRLEAARKE